MALGLAGRAALARSQAPKLLELARHGAFEGGHLEIEATRDGDEVRVALRNRYDAPVTADLGFTLANLSAVQPAHTMTVPAGGTQTAAVFHVIQPGQPIRYNYVMNWLFGDPASAPADVLYDLPYQHGEGFRVIQGYYGGFSHQDVAAIDWGMPEGTPVTAAREGTVVAFKDDATESGLDPDFKVLEKANWVVVRHPDGTLGCYFHLKPHGVAVRAGQGVRRGTLLGYSGNTGFSNAPHLHFEVRTPIDGKRFRTYPVRFHLATGDGIPLLGAVYRAP